MVTIEGWVSSGVLTNTIEKDEGTDDGGSTRLDVSFHLEGVVGSGGSDGQHDESLGKRWNGGGSYNHESEDSSAPSSDEGDGELVSELGTEVGNNSSKTKENNSNGNNLSLLGFNVLWLKHMGVVKDTPHDDLSKEEHQEAKNGHKELGAVESENKSKNDTDGSNELKNSWENFGWIKLSHLASLWSSVFELEVV